MPGVVADTKHVFYVRSGDSYVPTTDKDKVLESDDDWFEFDCDIGERYGSKITYVDEIVDHFKILDAPTYCTVWQPCSDLMDREGRITCYGNALPSFKLLEEPQLRDNNSFLHSYGEEADIDAKKLRKIIEDVGGSLRLTAHVPNRSRWETRPSSDKLDTLATYDMVVNTSKPYIIRIDPVSAANRLKRTNKKERTRLAAEAERARKYDEKVARLESGNLTRGEVQDLIYTLSTNILSVLEIFQVEYSYRMSHRQCRLGNLELHLDLFSLAVKTQPGFSPSGLGSTFHGASILKTLKSLKKHCKGNRRRLRLIQRCSKLLNRYQEDTGETKNIDA